MGADRHGTAADGALHAVHDARTSDPNTDPQRWWRLAFIISANLLVYSGVTIMNIALPAAQDDLALGDSTPQWVVTIFAMAFGGLILLGGRIADVFGRRLSLVAGLLGYAVASLLGSAANGGAVLLAARALQGATGALVAAAALALLSQTFPHGPERGRAFAVLGAVMGLGGAGAFIVGGALTEASWRWCLFVGAPIGLLVAFGVARTAVADPPRAQQRLDVFGAALITGAIATLIAGFDRATVDGWGSATTIVALAAGIALLVAFVVVERRSSVPLLPLSIVTDRTRAAAYVAVVVLGIGVFAGFFLLTFYLQDVRRFSPTSTGLAFLPFGLSAWAGSRYVTPALERTSPRAVLVAGLVATAAGVGALTRLETDSSYVTGVLPTFVAMGFGATAVMVTASNVATTAAGSRSGVAGAVVGGSQQTGAAIGTALLSSIASSSAAAYARANGVVEGDLEAVVHGSTRAAAVGAIIVASGAIAVLALLRPGPTPSASPDQGLIRRANTPTDVVRRPPSPSR